MWRATSGGVQTLGEVFGSLDLDRVPHHLVWWGQGARSGLVPGQSSL
jgi:hypothetical protein